MDALQAMDILVALKLAALGDTGASVREIEAQLGISKSSVALSLTRLSAIRILRPTGGERRINRFAFWDLMEHGIQWIAPGEVGDFELGMPTAHSAEPLASQLLADGDPYVIPLPHGPIRGRAVTPIHPLAPVAATKDGRFYQLLVLADAFRVGRARERKIASEELRKWR